MIKTKRSESASTRPYGKNNNRNFYPVGSHFTSDQFQALVSASDIWVGERLLAPAHRRNPFITELAETAW